MASSTTVKPMEASDVPAATDLLYHQKISLTINQVMWKTWPDEVVQKARIRSAVEGSMDNPSTRCLKVVDNETGEILGVLVLSRVKLLSSSDKKENKEPEKDRSAPITPAGLDSHVLGVVVAALEFLNEDFAGIDHIEITALVIVQSTRRSGLGSQLTQFAFESAKADQVPLVVCSEPLSNNFFAKVGFREIKHRDLDLSEFAAPLSGFGMFRLTKMIWSAEKRAE